jgi:DNA polymerase III delta prime subunit
MTKKNPYSSYFLSENPFPVVPIPEEYPRIFVANQRALQRIIWQLNKVAKTNRPIHVVLVGPYGSGKTHLLRYLASEINQHIKGGLGAYVPHPGPDFISIYRRFIESLSYDKLRTLSKAAEERKLKETIIYHDFVTALVNLNDPNKTLEAWRWLTANSLTLEERRALRVATSIEREEEALNAFSALLKFLRSVGFRLICMLIDEFEEINSLMQIQKRRLFNDLRHLIDLNVSNFSLMVACTPHGWETVYEENAALVRRFSSNVVFLDPLDDQTAFELISNYLSQFRTNIKAFQQFTHKNGLCDDSSKIYPFTKDAINELCALSKGNTGEVLKYSGIAIELGVNEGHRWIDAEKLRLLVAQYYGKSVEVPENENFPQLESSSS